MESWVNKTVSCKYCRSNRVRKYGFVEGTQYYFCNHCRRKFSLNECLFKMKTPYYQVVTALDEYFKGSSINKIRDKLNQKYSNYPSSKTVYAWITRYTGKAINKYKESKLLVGQVWIIDGTIVKIHNQAYRSVDVIDRDTCFLLSSRLFENMENQDIRSIIEQAWNKAKRIPEKFLMNEITGYKEIFDPVLGGKTSRIAADSFGENANIQWLEIWKEAIIERTRVLERLKSFATADKYLEGFQVYYNYLRPHKGLAGGIPAEAAKVDYTSRSWEDIICKA